MRISRYLLLAACAGCLPAATAPATYATPDLAAAQANANAEVDAAMVARIDHARADAKVGGPKEAWRFSKEVEAAFQAGTVTRGKVDGPAVTTEAIGYLDAATKAERGQMLAAKGSLLITAGRKEEGVAALESSFAKPNLWPVAKLLELYADARPAEIQTVCKKARGVTKSDDERYALLDQCMHWGKNLTWASKNDVSFYETKRAEEEQQAAADNAAFRRQREAEREELHASFSQPLPNRSDSGSSSSSASSRAPVSVTIRSRCGDTVHVFYGDKPKYGSGTSSTISANSVQSHSFSAGDQMWIVDEQENGIANTRVSSGMSEIEVGCTGLSAR